MKICSRFKFPLVRKNVPMSFLADLFFSYISLLLQSLDFNKIILKECPESFDPVSVESNYDLRFIVMHEGKILTKVIPTDIFETLFLSGSGNQMMMMWMKFMRMLFLMMPTEVTPVHSCCNMFFEIQSLIKFAQKQTIYPLTQHKYYTE